MIIKLLPFTIIFFIFASLQSFAQLVAYKTYTAFFSKQRKSIKNKYSFILGGRSHCDHCYQTLNWKSIIPIFGILFYQFQCIKCKNHISKKYLYLELTSAIYGVTFFYFSQNILLTITTGFILSTCFIISYIDIKTYFIPTELLLILIIISLWQLFFIKPAQQNLIAGYLLNSQSLTLLSSFFWLIAFLLIYFIAKNKLGFADVKLVFIACLSIDFPYSLYLPSIAAAFALGYYILLYFKHGKKTNSFLNTKIPFGPYLCLALISLKLLNVMVK